MNEQESVGMDGKCDDIDLAWHHGPSLFGAGT